MISTKVSIIIANFNAQDFLENCLSSIFTIIRNPSFEVIVVDNGSRDGSVEMVRNRFPQARIIALGKNIGFGGASNVGAREATGTYLLFTNSDTEFVEEDSIKNITDFLESRQDIGMIGPRLLWEKNGKIQRSWSGIPTIPFALIHYTSFNKLLGKSHKMREVELLDLVDDETQNVGVLSGSSFMIRRDIFETVSGFDEEFFLYFEEFDLCRRVGKLGWGIFYFPGAKVIHYGGRSMGFLEEGERPRAFEDSRRRYFRKHHNLIASSFLEIAIKMDRKLLSTLTPRRRETLNK